MTRLALAALLLFGCASARPKPPPVEDPWRACYRVCDTEVRSFSLTPGEVSCVCKVRGEIQTKVMEAGL